MAKLLLLLTVITSLTFLLTQWVAFHYFDSPNKGRRVPNKLKHHGNLLKNVEILQNICKQQNINCTLIDTDLLRQFLLIEIEHRKKQYHEHEKCSLFCKKMATTFAVKGTRLHAVLERFIEALHTEKFVITLDEDYDKREESLENRHGKYKLVYHLFIERNNAFIHLLVVYPRLNHEWSYQCNFQSMHHSRWIKFLENSQFCCQENIIKPMDATNAMIDGIYLQIPQYLKSFLEELKDSKFTSCNYEQARTFYSIYGYDSTHESEMFRSKAAHILTIVVEVLSSLNVRFWLSSGTCLGWYRQCGFMPHSKDVDIGIWITDYKKEIIPAFREKGLALKHLFGKVDDSFELSFKIDDLKLDIFFFYEDQYHMWNGGTQARTGKKFKYLFSKFTLCWTTIDKLLVRVPCETNKYILANYGESWNKLVKTWDWKASPPNVKENGEWPEDERSNLIQMF